MLGCDGRVSAELEPREASRGDRHTHVADTVTLTAYSGGASFLNSFLLRARGHVSSRHVTLANPSARPPKTHSLSPNPSNPLLPPTQTMLPQNMPRNSSGKAAIEWAIVSWMPPWLRSVRRARVSSAPLHD